MTEKSILISEENFIPIAKPVKFPWISCILMSLYLLIMGFGLGWITGYSVGLKHSYEIVEEIYESNDGLTEGCMPW